MVHMQEKKQSLETVLEEARMLDLLDKVFIYNYASKFKTTFNKNFKSLIGEFEAGTNVEVEL